MNKELYNNCLICGKEYKRCRVCEENRGTWASWKQFTDCPECFKILTVVQGYTSGIVSKEDSCKELKKCDLSHKSTFLPRVKELVDEILEEEKPISVSEKEIEVPISTDEEGIEVVKTLKPALSPSPNKENKKSRRTVLPNM